MIIIKTKALSVGYDKKVVVDKVNITAIKGEILCILGPNGAGKTTILRTLSGLLKPIDGNVYIKEECLENINRKKLSKELAIVLTKKLDGKLMTCYEIISMGRYPHTGFFGKLSDKDNKIIFESLRLVNGENLAYRYFDELSDGEKQKILVARAIAQEPDIIVLDEPTTHLDIKHRLELMDILKKLSKEKGITVILSLHEIDIAIKSCDKVMLVKDNKIVAYGVPEDIIDENIIKKLYDLNDSNFNNLLGSIEMSNKNVPKVFVIGGSGYGSPIYRALTKMNIGLVTGVIHENDIDYEIAKTIGVKIIKEKPFSFINDFSYTKAIKLLNNLDIIIDSGCPIGKINRRNMNLIKYSLKKGKIVYSLRNNKEYEKVYGENFSKVIQCKDIFSILEDIKNYSKKHITINKKLTENIN